MRISCPVVAALTIGLTIGVSANSDEDGVATLFFSDCWPRPCANSSLQNYDPSDSRPPQFIQLRGSLVNDVPGEYVLALGHALVCPSAASSYNRVCNTTIWPEVAVSADGGLNWSCVASGADTDLAVSRLWPAVFTFTSGAQSQARALGDEEDKDDEVKDEEHSGGYSKASEGGCDMVCLAGGQDARPGLSASDYATALSSVYCSRNGSVWYPAAPLPTAAVAGVAGQLNDKILFVAGLRADGSADTFVGSVDTDRCTISSWVRRPGNSALANATQAWSISSPAMPHWKGPGNPRIAGRAAFFVGGGAVPAYTFEDVSDFPGSSLWDSSTSRDLWWTLDEGWTWSKSAGKFPAGSRPADPILQKGAMLKGILPAGNPFLAVNTSESRVLLLFMTNSMYVSLDDGESWGTPPENPRPFNTRVARPGGGGAGESLPSPYLIAPTLISTGVVSASNPAPVFTLLDPFSTTFFLGYAVDCQNNCPEGWKLAAPCSRSPYDAVCYKCSSCVLGETWSSSPCSVEQDTVCSPCTQCGETDMMAQPCMLESDTICVPLVGLPTIPPDVPAPGFVPEFQYGANPVADALLVTCTVAMWLLFIAAGGAFSLCAAGARSLIPKRLKTNLARRGSSALVHAGVHQMETGESGGAMCPAGSESGGKGGQPMHPAVWRMTAGHVAFVCYLALDVSILGRAARIDGVDPHDRPVIVGQGILGLVCLLLNAMGVYWQLQGLNEAALRIATPLKASSSALPALCLSPLWASFSYFLCLHEQVRVALVFCVHPLSSVWLAQHTSLILEEGRAFIRSSRDQQRNSADAAEGSVLGSNPVAGQPVEAWTAAGHTQHVTARLARQRLRWAAAASVAATDGVHTMLAGLLLVTQTESLAVVLAGASIVCACVSVLYCMTVVAAREQVGTLQPAALKGARTRTEALAHALMGIPASPIALSASLKGSESVQGGGVTMGGPACEHAQQSSLDSSCAGVNHASSSTHPCRRHHRAGRGCPRRNSYDESSRNCWPSAHGL